MSSKQYASGAFVFTRPRGLRPTPPDQVLALADKHGLDHAIIPTYAGDRAAIGRAIQHTSAGLIRESILLRPIKRTSAEVVYGIIRESRNEVLDTVSHRQEGTLQWRRSPNPELIVSDHPVVNRVLAVYLAVRGMIVTEDWSPAISRFLEDQHGTAIRKDGRVYWLPPQSLPAVRQLQVGQRQLESRINDN